MGNAKVNAPEPKEPARIVPEGGSPRSSIRLRGICLSPAVWSLGWPRGRRTAVLAIACGAILGLSACGGSSSGASNSPTSAASSAGLAAAQAFLAQHEAIPTFQAPGPAFDASKARGKVLYNIPASSSIPPIQLTDGTLVAISQKL